MAAPDDQPDVIFSPTAAVFGWLLPGGGHLFIHKQRARGLAIMAGTFFLIIAGLLIGGIDVVDRQRDSLWFLAQALNGPVTFIIDWVNQGWIHQLPPDEYQQAMSFGRVNELGTLFVALAGLMNLVAILDALQFQPKQPTTPRRRTDDRPEVSA